MTDGARSAVLTVLFDTNVILDLVLAREPWASDAALLLAAVERGVVAGWMASHAVTTVNYIVSRESGRTAAASAVGDLLQLLMVVPLDSTDFQRALVIGLGDYEDAVQVAACLRVGADYLVTRNARDFKGARVEVETAGGVLAVLEARGRSQS